MVFTVQDLIQELKGYPEGTELTFQGELTFYRMKWRGRTMVQLEFNEPVGYLEDKFRKKNPHVKVAFLHNPPMEEGEAISGPFDASVR